MLPAIERVYVHEGAGAALGWTPRHDFRRALDRLAVGEDWRSALAHSIGARGYHASPHGL
jgi:UDP-glucose 4-epimerase